METYIERAQSALLGVYKRFPITFSHGKGSWLYDTDSNEYIDFAGGIAVNSLGHAHPELNQAINEQVEKLIHVSNLFYTIPQIELAEKLNALIGPGKIFFSNSGAEANECLIKLARIYGNSFSEKKTEVITMHASFHGRTMAGISATGQEKVKLGFDPLLSGFTHIPFNDIEAVKKTSSSKTSAIIIEGIQGEGGIISAKPEFLLELRKWCNENKILLLFDAVQCGFFRTGSFQSYAEILREMPKEDTTKDSCSELKPDFIPDAISMAKSLGGGFPIGATWISDSYSHYLGAGTHGSTYGGNPLACKVSSKIIEIIERDNLAINARQMGIKLSNGLSELEKMHPDKLKGNRGLGLLRGSELHSFKVPDPYQSIPPSSYTCLLAQKNGLLLVPAGDHVVRFLPQLGVSSNEIDEALERFSKTINQLPL